MDLLTNLKLADLAPVILLASSSPVTIRNSSVRRLLASNASPYCPCSIVLAALRHNAASLRADSGQVAREKSTHHADALAGTRIVPIIDKNVEGLFLGSISRLDWGR